MQFWHLFLKHSPFLELLRPHRKTFFWGLFALGVVDLINVLLPIVTKVAVDALGTRSRETLWWAAGGYLGLMAAQAYGRYLWRIYLIGSSHKVAEDLRNRLLGHLQKLPVSYYQSVTTGDLMSRATNDVESVRMAVGPGMLVTADMVMILGMIVPAMFWLSPKLALLSLAFFPFVPWLTLKVGHRIDLLFGNLQERLSHISGFAQETFAGIRVLKALVLEHSALSRFRQLSEAYRKEGIELAKYQAIFSPSLGFITQLGTLLILWVGGNDVLSGALSIGTLVAFQRFVVQLSWPLEAVGWAVTMNREGAAAYRRLEKVLEVPEVQEVYPEKGQGVVGAEGLWLRNVQFRYPSGGFQLRLENLRLEQGKRVGLVGPVGSGKSTLLNLILRLTEPEAGAILFHGRDVRSITLSQLRQRIGSVEQQVFLFGETLEENIRLGSRYRDSVEPFLQKVCLQDEVHLFERGIHTPLGERGITLSGGQKQRVALARALYRRPEFLLLDDAFSAVDTQVEQQIIRNLLEMDSAMGILLSTHRLSIAPQLDTIWFLAAGEVLDWGSHAELLQRCAPYREMYDRNLREERLGRLGLAETVEAR